jgi:hypothetical protein
LSRPPLLLSLADLLPSRSGHLPAAFLRCSEFRRKVGNWPARSFANWRWHRALADRSKRRKIPTDGTYLRLKFFDSSRGTDPSEFLELRCWSWHMGADHTHNWIASANAVTSAMRECRTAAMILYSPAHNLSTSAGQVVVPEIEERA